MKIKFYEEPDDKGGSDHLPATNQSEARAKFNEKFKAKLPPGTPGAEPEKVETPPADEKPPEKKEEIAKPDLKRPGSNVPRILEEKRTAEKERDELKAKLEKFEKEEKPSLEGKIKEMEEKLAKGGLSADEKRVLDERIDSYEKKLQEKDADIVNQTKVLRERLDYYDIQSNPQFREKFVKPIAEAYTDVVETFVGDEKKESLLRKALIANGSSLSAANAEEKKKYDAERNTILSQIAESMGEFEKGNFNESINRYLRATHTHAKALQAHEETNAELTKSREAESAKQRTEIFSTWTQAYDLSDRAYENDLKLDPDMIELAKELKLDPMKQLEEATVIAKKVITGRATMEQSIELIHRGRLSYVLEAKVATKDHQLKEAMATIEKLKGSSSGGGGAAADKVNPPPVKKSREEWQKKFTAAGRETADAS